MSIKSKSKQCIAVRINLAFTATGNSHAILDHTVLPATRQRWESRFYPQPKQVLDLATPEGCKAELTYVTLYKRTGRELNQRPINRKSNTLPRSHHANANVDGIRTLVFVWPMHHCWRSHKTHHAGWAASFILQWADDIAALSLEHGDDVNVCTVDQNATAAKLPTRNLAWFTVRLLRYVSQSVIGDGAGKL